MKPSLSESIILNLLAQRACLSVSQMADHLDLPTSTVLSILNRLAAKGYVTQGPALAGRRGRPATTYRLSLPKPVAAFLIERTRLAGAVIGQDLGLCARETLDGIELRSMKEAMKMSGEVFERLLSSSKVQKKQLGEAVFSFYGAEPGGKGLFSSALPWADSKLGEGLEKSLGMPVRLLLHTPVALMAEFKQWGETPPQSMVRFKVGDGVSAYCVIGDEVYHGASGLAGELGHLVIEPNGRQCGCGGQGCLEAYTSGPAIHRQFQEALQQGVAHSIDLDRLSSEPSASAIEMIWQVWRQGDNLAWVIMGQVFDRLAWALSQVVNWYDPELIVFTGYVLEEHPEWLEEIKRRAMPKIVQLPGRKTRFETSKAGLEDELREIGISYHLERIRNLR